MEKITTLQQLLLAASIAMNRAPNENQREELHTFATGLEKLLVKLYQKSKRDVQLPRLMTKLFVPTCWALILLIATWAINHTYPYIIPISPLTLLVQIGLIVSLSLMSLLFLRRYTAINKIFDRYTADFAPSTGSEVLTKKELLGEKEGEGLNLEWKQVPDKNASRDVTLREMKITLPGGPAWKLFMSELEHLQTKAPDEPPAQV